MDIDAVLADAESAQSAESTAPAEAEGAGDSAQSAQSAALETTERGRIAAHFQGQFAEGASYSTITQARKEAGDLLSRPIRPGTSDVKLVDEGIEAGAVLYAKSVAQRTQSSPQAKYQTLVTLYETQMPRLASRTSTSIEQQAYSTPLPLAFLGGELVGIDGQTRVYEPSAGQGALVMAADPANVVANELNADRADMIRTIMPQATVTTNNAANWKPEGTFDVVIANPPFGAVKDESGRTIEYDVDERYTTKEIDHAISLKALEAMADDGRGLLIVGSVAKTAGSDEARADAYNSKAKREFYITLYEQYNVVDHFTVPGELYAKQGAGWPVDVIVIEGRGKSPLPLPAVTPPRMYDNWQTMGELLDATTTRPARRPSAPVSGPDAAGARGSVAGGAETSNAGDGATGGGSRPIRFGAGAGRNRRPGNLPGRDLAGELEGAGATESESRPAAGNRGDSRPGDGDTGNRPANVKPAAQTEFQNTYRPTSASTSASIATAHYKMVSS